MAFEISEYVYFTSIILVAALLTTTAGPMLIGLGTALFVVSTYAVLLRKSADHESARLARIIGSLIVILLCAVSGASALALLTLIWAMGVLIITVSEHITHRGYIPIESA